MTPKGLYGQPLPEGKKSRREDKVFDALQRHCEIENPLTTAQRGKLQVATHDLRAKCPDEAKLLQQLDIRCPVMKEVCRKAEPLKRGLRPTYVSDEWERFAPKPSTSSYHEALARQSAEAESERKDELAVLEEEDRSYQALIAPLSEPERMEVVRAAFLNTPPGVRKLLGDKVDIMDPRIRYEVRKVMAERKRKGE